MPEIFDAETSVFATRQYLLPTLVVAAWGIVGAICGTWWLPADALTWRQALAKLSGRAEDGPSAYAQLSTRDEDGPEEDEDDGQRTPRGGKESEMQSYLRLLRDRETRLAVSTRVLLPMCWVTCKPQDIESRCATFFWSQRSLRTDNELLPLWCKSKQEDGGLGWSARQIGTIMSIQGVALMFYQPIFFPPLTRKLGVVNSFRFGAVMFTTCIFTLPLIGRLAAYPTLLWPVFALQRVLDMVSGASCGGAGQLLIINAANEGEQGRLQGLAGGLASMAMSIFPAIGGAIWSFTHSHFPYPLHPHVPYAFCGSLALVMVYVSMIMPKTLEKPKKERGQSARQPSGPAKA